MIIYSVGALQVTDRSWTYGLKRYPLAELHDLRLERGVWSPVGKKTLPASLMVAVATILLGRFGPQWLTSDGRLWTAASIAAVLLVIAAAALRLQPRSHLLTARRGPVRVVLLASHSRGDVEEAADAFWAASSRTPWADSRIVGRAKEALAG